MKQCPNCACNVADESQFCPACGSAVPATPAAVVATATEPAAPAVTESPAPKKKLSGKLIAIICIAAVLIAAVVFVIIGFATNWFAGPMSTIRSALNKISEADSYTLKMDFEYEYENDGDNMSQSVKIKHVKDFATINQTDGKTILTYNNKQYILSEDFASVSDLPDVEDAEISYSISDLLSDIIMNNDIEEEKLDEIIDDLKLEADAEDLANFLDSLEKDCLNNNKWLEEFFKLKKDGNTYSFKIDADDLMKEIVNRAYEADVISKSDKKDLLDEDYNTKYTLKIQIEKGYPVQMEVSIKSGDNEISYEYKYSKINETEIDQDDVDEIIDDVEAYMAEYYSNCAACDTYDRKDSMRHINDKYYCSDCYYEMDYCDDCGEFIREEDLTRIDYNDLCAECYKAYKEEYYSSCVVCDKEARKNSMYQVDDDWYCSSCYYERRHCADCDKFVKTEDMVSISYNYTVCLDCYELYKVDHTCDQCSAVVGLDYLCPFHDTYDRCDGCGDTDYLSYHVVKKQNLCYSCAEEPIQ